MTDLISCPKCHSKFELTAVMQAQLAEQLRGQLQQEFTEKLFAIENREKSVSAEKELLTQRYQELDSVVQQKLATERQSLLKQAADAAREQVAMDLESQAQQVGELQGKLREAQKHELELRQREQQLAAETEELKLKVARELADEREKIRQTALMQFSQEHQLKDAEREKIINDMRRQIESLKQKAEQGSVQIQGEVMEEALENLLQTTFVMDHVTPVAKGVRGADVLQLVRCSRGLDCGTILWESKRTKTWNDEWIQKLRNDQREARASVAVIVTQSLPSNVENICCLNGIWICSWACAAGLGMALRSGIIEISKAKLATQGQSEKIALVYEYLSGKEFQLRIAGAVEPIITMQAELNKEKRAIQSQWAKRETQILRAISSLAGMYGDLQGHLGTALPPVEGLQLISGS